MKSPLTSCERSYHNVCNWAIFSPVLQDGCSCCQVSPRHAVLVRVLMIWKAIKLPHIFKGIVVKVLQYVDERFLPDKCHLGDMIAQVVQLTLKSRPRN
ncbi:hypothetical protein TNCV_1764951 [Trichonephila clavipes]|nr:hypothetical protein TNCV_1764951 [Trichonephila clavipes]